MKERNKAKGSQDNLIWFQSDPSPLRSVRQGYTCQELKSPASTALRIPGYANPPATIRHPDMEGGGQEEEEEEEDDDDDYDDADDDDDAGDGGDDGGRIRRRRR